jgi:hypothetical protein
MMHFGIPILAHGCSFNRHTTEERAKYFTNVSDLIEAVRSISPKIGSEIGTNMEEIAHCRYTWHQIGQTYFECMEI